MHVTVHTWKSQDSFGDSILSYYVDPSIPARVNWATGALDPKATSPALHYLPVLLNYSNLESESDVSTDM